MPDTLVLGLGNILLGDEGVGVRVGELNLVLH
jgi:Ni,Fe-hydrogenase maturation factor